MSRTLYISSTNENYTIEYSLDNGATWTEDTKGEIDISSLSEGEFVLLRGENCYSTGITYSSSADNVIMTGDINSLLNKVGGPVEKTGLGPMFLYDDSESGRIEYPDKPEALIDSGDYSVIDCSSFEGKILDLKYLKHGLLVAGDGEDFSTDYLYINQTYPVNITWTEEKGKATINCLAKVNSPCELAFWLGYDENNDNAIDGFSNVIEIIFNEMPDGLAPAVGYEAAYLSEREGETFANPVYISNFIKYALLDKSGIKICLPDTYTALSFDLGSSEELYKSLDGETWEKVNNEYDVPLVNGIHFAVKGGK